jgi:hypothetical protein
MTSKGEPDPPFAKQSDAEQQAERARSEAAAYYAWPLVWVGAAPDNIHVSVPPGEMPPDLELSQLEQVVVEADLPQGVRIRAHRDGMFVFDFSTWAPYTTDPAQPLGDFFELANLVLRRVALMNAHVACLHTAILRIQNIAHGVTALSPSGILPMSPYDAPEGVSLPDPRIGHIHSARYAVTYSSHLPMVMDWRIGHRMLVETPTVEESFRLLGGLLSHGSTEQVIALADLIVRSAAAYGDHDYNQALMTAWAITESLLQELWERYIEDNRQREIDGLVVPFINADRKKRLTEDRDITASLTAEMLSLHDRLPLELYRDLSTVRVARNKWIHDLDPVSADTAGRALAVAEEMLRLVEQIDLSMTQGLSLQI